MSQLASEVMLMRSYHLPARIHQINVRIHNTRKDSITEQIVQGSFTIHSFNNSASNFFITDT